MRNDPDPGVDASSMAVGTDRTEGSVLVRRPTIPFGTDRRLKSIHTRILG